MSSIIDKQRHIASLVKAFNKSLLATLEDEDDFAYISPKNAAALNYRLDFAVSVYVGSFVVRTVFGDFYTMKCKPCVSKQTAREICEQYQVICMLC